MALAPLFGFSLLVHALLAWILVPDLAPYSVPLAWAFGLWTLVSAGLMPMGMVALRFARPPMAQVLTWSGLLCMGLFSSLLVLALLRILLLPALGALHGIWPLDLQALRTASALLVAPLALLMTALGFWNARRTPSVVRVDVPVANLPDALVGFSMAQISDIHVGPTIRQPYLERIVARVNRLDADLVAITGDLVDGPVRTLGSLVQPLQDLRSRYGSYFVTGNHEYYSGAQEWVAHLRSLGIQVLMNEHVLLQHSPANQPDQTATLVLAGVSDYSAHHFDSSQQSDPVKALAGAPAQAAFKVLLAHQPRSAAAADKAGFDLQLSGHTHGGQFWPWGYFVRLQQPFTAGLHRLNRLWVYTSRGTGYWGPPKRFGAPSEITYLRLVRAGQARTAT
ncbi:MAG: metallophosphoesterase [Rhodoferax sp.]|nr:metallophosphoesterase [Rhodoferax sp.]